MVRARSFFQRLMNWFRAIWPWLPLALILVVIGVLNILTGLRYQPIFFHEIRQLNLVTKPLSFLGDAAQVISGAILVVAGVGMFWRSAAAWAFAVLMLLITVAVNVAQARWDASLYLSGLILLALFFFRRHFTRQTIFANFLFSLLGVMAILAYGVLGTYLLGSGFHPPVSDLFTALYYTVVTLSTVGYGDITPATPEARIFAVSLIIVGLSVFATVIASAVGPAVSRELDLLFRPQRKKMKPTNHVILTGEGAIACNTARELLARGIPFVRILVHPCEPLLPEDALVRGNPVEDQILRQAGIDTARLVIAALDTDGENALLSLIAKDLNPSVRVLAVATSAKSMRRLQLAGAEIVFAPAVVGSRLMADLVEEQEIPEEFRDLLEGRPSRS
jgi:voltage-gated potassium channel